MPDIIVTTPKSEREAARREAEDVRSHGGGHYFRVFPRARPDVGEGDRVFYVEDGYVRGFARVVGTQQRPVAVRCQTTGRLWGAGFYVIMDAATWTWIRPVPMRGFQGWRYARFADAHVETVGGGWTLCRRRRPL